MGRLGCDAGERLLDARRTPIFSNTLSLTCYFHSFPFSLLFMPTIVSGLCLPPTLNPLHLTPASSPVASRYASTALANACMGEDTVKLAIWTNLRPQFFLELGQGGGKGGGNLLLQRLAPLCMTELAEHEVIKKEFFELEKGVDGDEAKARSKRPSAMCPSCARRAPTSSSRCSTAASTPRRTRRRWKARACTCRRCPASMC